MFLFFWIGHKTSRKKIGSGRFVCPSCGKKRSFTRYALTSQPALYSLIPIWKPRDIGHVIVCDACRSEFPADILMSGPVIEPGQGTVWVCRECGNVNPVQRPACLKCGRER